MIGGDITWTTVLVAVLNLLVGGVLVALIRSRPALNQIANAREANLLTERADDMKDMRVRIARLEAERAADRHRINNQRLMIYSLLHLFDIPPARRKNALERIRADLAAMEQAEAAEKGALAAGTIVGEME